MKQSLKRIKMSKKDYYSWSRETKCIPGFEGISVFPKKNTPVRKEGKKTYVPSLKGKVMLAKSYTDNMTGDPIKLKGRDNKKLYTNPPDNWLASEKFDGVRAVWDGQKFVSRLGKVFSYVPLWIQAIMPPSVALDGEIFMGRGEFQTVVGISNIEPGGKYSEEEIDSIWKNVHYQIFDIMALDSQSLINLPFSERLEILEEIINERCKCFKHLLKFIDIDLNECPLVLTKNIVIKNHEHLTCMFKDITQNKGEGVILRHPDSPYLLKRSELMLKTKIVDDAECILKGISPGTGKYNEIIVGPNGEDYPVMGALKCQMMEKGKLINKFFNIGTGFTDEMRENYWNPESKYYMPFDSIVNYSYMELTDDGFPRCPVFRGIREDIDLPIQEQKKKKIINLSKDNLTNCIKIKIIRDLSESQLRECIIQKKEKSMNEKLIWSFQQMINKVVTTRESGWNFKRNNYNKVIGMLKRSKEEINTMEKARKMLLEGWKDPTKILEKFRKIIEEGELPAAIEASKDPKTISISSLIKIPGIGEKKAHDLYGQGIKSIEEYRKYSIDNVPTSKETKVALKYFDDLFENEKKRRIPRNIIDKVKNIIEPLYKELTGTDQLYITGSYRRNEKDSGDIDMIITGNTNNLQQFITLLKERGLLLVDGDFVSGKVRFRGLAKIPNYPYVFSLDIMYSKPEEFPFALLHFTGSVGFSEVLRAYINSVGLSINERKLTKHKTKADIPKKIIMEKIGKDIFETEEDIFNFFSLPYINPKDRTREFIISLFKSK